uniref:Uncharacterized protein n=1 Tax=Arundo donax TaxID=35708 RepID=A0A0A9CCC0_ARUDO
MHPAEEFDARRLLFFYLSIYLTFPKYPFIGTF